MTNSAQHRSWISKMRPRTAGVTLMLAGVLVLGLVASPSAQAQTFTVLYNFTGGSDGSTPYAGVIQDPAGNLYGTTYSGGSSSDGVVFKVNTTGTETTLHTFSGPDGANPYTPVARDKAGNIYGTTAGGGSAGYGTVFKIDKAGNETVLYNFAGGSDGCYPFQGLIRDKAGNWYGTTAGCGAYYYYGTIFKVDSAGNFTLLHSFTAGSSDAGYPYYGHLTMDKSGNLYGVTEAGGAYGYGVLYKLSKGGTLTLLYSFKGGSDGCEPNGSVVQDKAGNFYGTTYWCGSNYWGTIWKVSKKGKETILHNFAAGSRDGCYPIAGVGGDSKGNLYGVTTACGANNYGAVYELSAKGTLTLLPQF